MYYYSKRSKQGFEKTVENIKEELKREGFGVLTEINVKETLKKKLDVDYEDYMILGACNPPFAYKALLAEKNIGVMLPCNVIIYSLNGEIIVSAVMPTSSMSNVKNSELMPIADQIEAKLKLVVDRI